MGGKSTGVFQGKVRVAPDAQKPDGHQMSRAILVSENGKRIHVHAGSDKEMVWISVRDEGPGLVSEEAEKVFDRFWRADQVSAREAGRSGLGLAIVKTIVESHGGRTTVRSTKDVGSTFTIWLHRLLKG